MAPQLISRRVVRMGEQEGEEKEGQEVTEVHQSLQSRAVEAMDNMWHKACEKGEEAEIYVEKAMKKAWDAWKTCHISDLPSWLQDNELLHTGHRPPLKSFQACFWSIFRLHTESVNIWTHLIGCIIFACLAVYVYFFNPHPLHWEDKLVFGSFFLGAIICLGMSSSYHTFACHSPHVGRLFSRLDYCGIALLITGSIVPFLYYGFYCEYLPKVCYILIVLALGVLTTVVSLSETFSLPHYRPVRASVFTGFGCSGIIPGIHWFFSQESLHLSSLWYSLLCLILMGVLYVTGAILYALRVPERFFPGKCDYWFHSHQLFHVLVIAAAVVHYNGISELALYRLTSSSDMCDAR